jgi:hypothetical protein
MAPKLTHELTPPQPDRSAMAAVGILAHGGNHFIVRGPLPDRSTSLALAAHWSIIQIAAAPRPELDGWKISTREFRENLSWAVIVPGDGEISAAVAQLLRELSERGVTIYDSSRESW